MQRFAPIFALALAACAPNYVELSDATLTGWLNEETSFTLYQGLFDPTDVEENWTLDCRELEANEEYLRLDENLLDVCGGDNPNFAEAETWFNGQAWHGFQMPLDNAWRGEGFFSHEGDLQVGFHHRMPGGEDFRFVFAIDPDFMPTECVVQNGETVAAPIDGTPILDSWKETWADIDVSDVPAFLAEARTAYPDGQLYPLNARSYQFDIDNLDEPSEYIWTLPEEWMGGFARGTFGAEDMHSRPSRFAETETYLITDAEDFVSLPRDSIWFADDCTPGTTAAECSEWVLDRNAASEFSRQVSRDLSRAMPGGLTANYRPIHIDNAWREVDDAVAGLDRWNQLEYGWVVLSADSFDSDGAIGVGSEVTGAFSILMDPDDSNSRFLVQGHFTIPRVKKEKWAGPDLYAEKLEENGVDLCIQ